MEKCEFYDECNALKEFNVVHPNCPDDSIEKTEFIDLDDWTFDVGVFYVKDFELKLETFLPLFTKNELGVDVRNYFKSTNGKFYHLRKEKIDDVLPISPRERIIFEGRIWTLCQNEPKTIYYAHPINLYNTKQEERDLELLEKLFPYCEIINPNNLEISEKYLKSGYDMEIFTDIIEKCDIVAFRSLPDSKITSGVYTEAVYAVSKNISVFELPNLLSSRAMSVSETRGYLSLIGQR